MLDAGLPLRHEAKHTQRLAIALGRQRLGNLDARDAAILLYIEDGYDLALSLQFAGFLRILQRPREPLHELDGSSRILRQVFDDVEIERIGGVDIHRGQGLFVLGLQVGQQRLVVVALALHELFGRLQLYGIVDDIELLALLRLRTFLELGDGLFVRHRYQLALVHEVGQVDGIEIVGGRNGIPLQRDIAQGQHEDEPQEKSRGALLVDISLWSLLLFHSCLQRYDILRIESTD